MSRIVALIPARSGSKGVPHKNMKKLGGHSLIDWSIKACSKSEFIDRVIVSTDSQDYASVAISLGAEAPFLRPPEISGDYSTDYDFVLHALNWISNDDCEPELLVHIRPTTPYRTPPVIDQAIEAFRSEPRATSLRSVHEMPESAYKTFEIARAGQLKQLGSSGTLIDEANAARQLFPATYQANGYVDVLLPSFVRSHGLIHGDWVLPFITSTMVEVDTEDDFAYLEWLLDHNPEIAHQLFA